MFAFACGERDGWDVGDFHEFESAFKCCGGADSSAQEKEHFRINVFLGDLFNLLLLRLNDCVSDFG